MCVELLEPRTVLSAVSLSGLRYLASPPSPPPLSAVLDTTFLAKLVSTDQESEADHPGPIVSFNAALPGPGNLAIKPSDDPVADLPLVLAGQVAQKGVAASANTPPGAAEESWPTEGGLVDSANVLVTEHGQSIGQTPAASQHPPAAKRTIDSEATDDDDDLVVRTASPLGSQVLSLGAILPEDAFPTGNGMVDIERVPPEQHLQLLGAMIPGDHVLDALPRLTEWVPNRSAT